MNVDDQAIELSQVLGQRITAEDLERLASALHTHSWPLTKEDTECLLSHASSE